MNDEMKRRLLALLDDERLRDCDETARVREAAALLAGDQPRRGTLALRELTRAYSQLRFCPGSTAEALLCPVVAELISLARAVQHCSDAEVRLVRELAFYEAARRLGGGAT